MKTTQIELTPKLAADFLKHNWEFNRPLRPVKFNAIAEVIMRNEWGLTHQGIAIGTDGIMYDGQHRCAAVVKCGKSITVLLTEGVDPKNYSKMDIGTRRTPGDTLHSAGYGDASNLAAAARVYHAYRKGLLGSAPWRPQDGRIGAMASITPALILETVENHPLLTELGPQSRLIATGVGRLGFRNGILVALTIIAEDAPLFDRLRGEWINALATGANLEPTSSALQWRNWAIRDQRRSRPEVVASIIKAWNLWQEGETTTGIRIVNGEEMPQVVALPKPRRGRTR